MKGNKERKVGTSGANAAKTVSTKTGAVRRLLQVLVAYSASPTQAGVSIKLNSGAGAGYDTVLNTGSANAQYTVYVPDGEVILMEDDVLDVTAPAGGAGITSSISIYTEKVGY